MKGSFINIFVICASIALVLFESYLLGNAIYFARLRRKYKVYKK